MLDIFISFFFFDEISLNISNRCAMLEKRYPVQYMYSTVLLFITQRIVKIKKTHKKKPHTFGILVLSLSATVSAINHCPVVP